MVKKSLLILKKNPIIFIMMVVFMLLMMAASLPLQSITNKIMDYSQRFYDFSGGYSQFGIQDYSDMMSSARIVYLISLAMGVISLAFMSGYGNMIAAAMNEGKASLKIFLYGFRKFFGKVLLSALLLMVVLLCFSFVVSIIAVPLIIVITLAGSFQSFDASYIYEGQRIIVIVTIIIMSFLYPLMLMWIPAIFTDRNDGVIKCFKNGFRASRKKYLQLLTATVLMLLPTLLLFLLSENIFETLKTPGFYLSYPFQAVILPVVITYLFVMYQAFKSETGLAGNKSGSIPTP